jgi:hypothetical protein
LVTNLLAPTSLIYSYQKINAIGTSLSYLYLAVKALPCSKIDEFPNAFPSGSKIANLPRGFNKCKTVM